MPLPSLSPAIAFRSLPLRTDAALTGSRTPGPRTESPGFAAVLASRRIEKAAAPAVAAPGRNPALADPDSAYRMMSEINRRSVVYRAERSVMDQLAADVRELGSEARALAQVALSGSDNDLVAAMTRFADHYNAWQGSYGAQMAPGGLLAGTQAAKVARWEFARSLDNMFHGATAGLRGMRAIGLSVRRGDDSAQLDANVLRGALARQPDAVRATIRDCATDFARCADLLNSPKNFIPNRQDNLSRAVAWIDANLSSLQAEFGSGDAYRLPSGKAGTT